MFEKATWEEYRAAESIRRKGRKKLQGRTWRGRKFMAGYVMDGALYWFDETLGYLKIAY